MSEVAKKPSLKDRLLEAIIRRIEGTNDFKQKAELLVKSNPETIKSMSDLSENQVDAIATAQWVGLQFPSMKPLATLMTEFAAWSPSKKGERAKQLTATMISEHTNVIPMALQPNMQGNQNKKERKESEKQQ
jgi:hypothetical protein